MLKRTMAVVFAVVLAMTAGSVAAQTGCSVGAYADTQGTVNLFQPVVGTNFDVYVVLFTENLANAVAYTLDVPGLNSDIFQMGVAYGPTGTGINITTANGNNVGLGDCAVGFGGLPVVVARYTFLIPFDGAPTRTMAVAGNCDEDCNFPVYSDCLGNLSPCDVGPALQVEGPVATESASFGAVKSLFGN